jgi:hypothetical protein
MQHLGLCRIVGIFLFPALMLPDLALAEPSRPPFLNSAHSSYPPPKLPFDEVEADAPDDDTLEAAIAEAFTTNPELAARR